MTHNEEFTVGTLLQFTNVLSESRLLIAHYIYKPALTWP